MQRYMYSILFYSVLFCSILFYSSLFYSSLFYSILFRFTYILMYLVEDNESKDASDLVTRNYSRCPSSD